MKISWGKRNINILISILIGITCFILIYGTNVLDVTYDGWIFSGYIEKDIIQHYSGWMIFRNSVWTFPLGIAQNMAYPVGGAISYTDSIPLFSIFFKALSPILPTTFQFFGWYVLLSFVLQAISAGMLVGLFTKNKTIIAISTILFVISPVLIERSFRHTSLSSQYLILFAWYLLLSSKQKGYTSISWKYVILNALAITIHPYFVVMVSGIFGAHLLGYISKNKKILPIVIPIIENLLVIGLIGYSIGVFIPDVSEQSVGFGTFAMNLNALINPLSLGVNTWSKFVKQYPQAWGNYDGFNYLGVGVIFFYGFMVINEIKLFIEKGDRFSFKIIFNKCKLLIYKYYEILLISLLFFLFAISNYIKYGTHILIHYELPEFALKVANIFRASSRMFYPVFYLIFLLIIVWIIKRFKTKVSQVLLLFLVLIQVVDISPALLEKHASLGGEKTQYYNMFTNGEWSFYATQYDKVYLLENTLDYDLAAYIGNNNLVSNIFFLNRGGSMILKENYKMYIEQIRNGTNVDTNAFYVTGDAVLYQYLVDNLDKSKFETVDFGYLKVFLPKKS